MPEGRYSRVNVETEANVLSDAQIAATFKPSVSVPWAVITVLITSMASVVGTYLATHSTPVDCASHGEVNALDKRVSDLNQTVSALTTTVNANADRSHNDIAILNGTLLALTRQK
jgi:outer membrane murein-binding lipoprotein Lpp